MTPLQTLQTDGIVEVPGLSPVAACEMLTVLTSCSTTPGHVYGAGVAPDDAGSATAWALPDVLAAPHWWEWSLAMTTLVGEYLGQEPLLYSLNAFTTYPSESRLNPHIQEFHRDKDDAMFVAAFLYLTTIETVEDGPHQFHMGSHTGRAVKTLTIYGPAGTAFLEDPRGLHRGMRPETTPRTLAWARWCVSDPPRSYGPSRTMPVSKKALGRRYPTDPGLQRVIRLVVQ